MDKSKSQRSKPGCLFGLILSCILIFDLWYFVLWPHFGWCPFGTVSRSEIKSISVVLYDQEVKLSRWDMNKVIRVLRNVEIYPIEGDFACAEYGYTSPQFYIEFEDFLIGRVSVAEDRMYFKINDVPFLISGYDMEEESAFYEIREAMIDKYFRSSD